MFHIFSPFSWQLACSGGSRTRETDSLVFLTDNSSERPTSQPLVAGSARPPSEHGERCGRLVVQLPGRITSREQPLVSRAGCREGREELGFLVLRGVALIDKEQI